MKKIILGSLTLTIFTFSVLIFQSSCKKEATAQVNASNCNETAVVNFTINFPTSFNPLSTTYTENNITLSNLFLESNPHCEYWQDFRDVGSMKQKVFTFKGVVPGVYQWRAAVKRSSNTYDFVKTNTNQITIVAGQTYNITINNTDFK